MTLHFQSFSYVSPGVSTAPNPSAFWFAFKQFMKSYGWTVPQSSDGVSNLDQTGSDVITSAGTGANGMANASSWFILQEPSGGAGGNQRQFLFFKNGTALTPQSEGYRMVAYSVQGFRTDTGHGSTSVSVTNPPIAYDMIWHYLASTTPSPPNFYNQTISTSNPTLATAFNWFPTRYNNLMICCSDTAPFFWYIMSWSPQVNVVNYTTTSNINAFVCYDPLSSFDTGDTDPTMVHFYFGLSSMVINTTSGSYNTIVNYTESSGGLAYRFSWYKQTAFASKADASSKITAGTTLPIYNTGMASYCWSTTANAPSNFLCSDLSGVDSSLPCVYGYYPGTTTTNYYFKGVSNYLRTPMVGKQIFSLASMNSPRDYLYIGSQSVSGSSVSPQTASLMIPWNGSTLSF